MTTRTFDKDSVIFRQGDFSHDMYDIISGSVGIYTDYGRENENRITVLHAGDFLGEMGLIEIYPRSATAVAMEDGTTLQVIGEKEFSDYFKTRSDRLLAIMRQLSHRLRDLTEDYEAACKVRDALKETSGEKEKRSASLLEKARKYLGFYDNVMNASYQTDSGTFLVDPFIYRDF